MSRRPGSSWSFPMATSPAAASSRFSTETYRWSSAHRRAHGNNNPCVMRTPTEDVQRSNFPLYPQSENVMKRRSVLRVCTVGMAWLLTASCGLAPTEDDLNDLLENTLQSVN